MMASLTLDSTKDGDNRTKRTISPASETSTPLLGKQAQALIACNQKLQELGIDNTITLPQIVVVGDQSTGKSSLIEALSQVKVPKAKGCCTQCPIAINLSSGNSDSAPWTCTVSIEEHHTFEPTLVSKGVTKNNPFGPWQRRSQMNIVRVKTTTDKDEVPDLIRAAQAAILNPGTHYRDYLNLGMQRVSSTETTLFSPNVIRLDISEGGWTNLSFVDLPGVIANTGKEKNNYLVKLIENLVHQYAAAKRSVNMLTLPMTHDIENSRAYAVLQELNAESRTLAVLTKVDLADKDQRIQFLRKFTGDDVVEFEHGYHFVVMPDNMEQQEAREVETETFSQPPWSILDRKYRARLGVSSLRGYLRRLLFEKTREALPGNLSSIEERLVAVNAELAALPLPPNAALLPLQLQQSLTQFENAMKTMLLENEANANVAARTKWSNAATRFRNTVLNARPTLFLLTRSEQARLTKAQAKVQSSAHKKNGVEDAMDLSSDDENEPSIPTKIETPTNTPLDPVHRFRLEDIRDINERYYQACVPGEIELKAIEVMNRLSVQHWNAILDVFMNSNSNLLNAQVRKIVEECFGQYHHLTISQVIEDNVKTFIDNAINSEWAYAEEFCRLEREQPFTYDSETLKKKEAQGLRDRMEKRTERRLVLQQTEKAACGVVSKKKQKSTDDELEPDPFQTELLMSVKNRAYYEVASTRFVDNVCMGVFGRLLPTCTERLAEDLKLKLGLDDHTKHHQIIEWMTEDTAREMKRHHLVREKKRLTEGLEYIKQALGSESTSPADVQRRRARASISSEEQLQTPSKRKKTAHNDTDEDEQVTTPTPVRLAKRIRSVDIDD